MTGLGLAVLADVIAIALLAYGIYFRRYHRRDLLLAYVALNVGVMAVTAMLAGSGAGMGLGLGLFGILSIIRLRSDSITQEEVAYYFVSLAMGLVNGLHPGPFWVAPALSLLLVGLMYLVDHPGLTARSRRQKVTLDQAYPDVRDIQPALERLLQADIRYFVVLELDLVTDITVVDVRYRVRADQPRVAPSLRALNRFAS
ncbi:DUF4956 domain-containing protein [Kribbella sp. NBC_01245]|uniref:DUF4956 domain-containing protein n=1 Tax=Kribbella sp. NBC_01245 TaxID=2903578 RepID=UPI002E2AD66C|nr:DUF4956 domain-containing protein [Kribbella sp. NBC_01245]